MPATPAHVAAVLPLLRRAPEGWARAALIVGACVPDASYIWVPRTWGRVAHTVPGLFLYCLPVGLAVLVWLEGLVLPALREALPEGGGGRGSPSWGSAPPPRTVRGWGLVLGALLVGAATHLLWDGFTHRDMWPARVLYPGIRVAVGSHDLSLARVFQHVSSGVGLLVVLGDGARRSWQPASGPGGGGGVGAHWMGLPTLAGAGGGLVWRLSHPQSMGALEAQVWWAFWPTVTGALVGLTLGCGVVRWLARRAKR